MCRRNRMDPNGPDAQIVWDDSERIRERNRKENQAWDIARENHFREESERKRAERQEADRKEWQAFLASQQPEIDRKNEARKKEKEMARQEQEKAAAKKAADEAQRVYAAAVAAMANEADEAASNLTNIFFRLFD